MTYQEALDYLNSETAEGIKPDLTRITYLCERLGDPQLDYATVHVAGTNGKTTTARMVAAVLHRVGYQVGVYTSPHLISYTERIVIDGTEIAEADFAGAVERLIPHLDETNRQAATGRVTQFEALTALAFLLFREKNIDCGVIETGMGGTWDATNMIQPEVAVITNIALEHTDRLGDTLEEIAAEKAGVVKARLTCITGIEEPAIRRIVEERCAAAGAPIKILGRDFRVIGVEGAADRSQRVSIAGLFARYDDLVVPLAGEYQATNAALAVACCEAFLAKQDRAGELPKVLPEALATVQSPGRLEVVQENPMVVLDGAHNPAGARELASALKSAFDYDRLILVVSILADKDVDSILRELVPLANTVVVTQAASDRAVDADALADKVSRLTSEFSVEREVAGGIGQAIRRAGPRDLVLVTGSLYTVGEAKQYLTHARRV